MGRMNLEAKFERALGCQLEDRLAEAEGLYRELLALDPEQPAAAFNLGIVLRRLGRPLEALEAYDQALALDPFFTEAHNNRGMVLGSLGRLDDSIRAFQASVELDRGMASAWNNLGVALKDQGRIEEASACLREAVRLRPEDPVTQSNLVFTEHYRPGSSPEDLLHVARAWAEAHAAPLASLPPRAQQPRERLRIGYVSGNFRFHCQALFLVPLLEHHDHDRHMIVCYSDVAAPDAATGHLKGKADLWRDIAGMGDEQVADLVRQDEVDILVDLTLHMSHNRLRVFARRPAPVQATWLGYPGTTGLEAIDYRLSDPWLDPVDAPELPYAERTLRLPDTFWCFDPLSQVPVNPLPALEKGWVTLGCLNNFCKVNDRVLGLWARVLAAIPRSRLLLMAPPGWARAHALELLGVAEERVEFVAFQPRDSYLETYHRIDFGLDTFPYGGHTTSLDAWWMGVPVLTLRGGTIVSRAGHSLLANLGLEGWVADTEDEFVARAGAWAACLPELSALRGSVRARMEASPLMNAPRFARNLEEAYARMWAERGLRPS